MLRRRSDVTEYYISAQSRRISAEDFLSHGCKCCWCWARGSFNQVDQVRIFNDLIDNLNIAPVEEEEAQMLQPSTIIRHDKLSRRNS